MAGKAKDLRRAKHKKKVKPMNQTPKDLEVIHAQATKRYKVEVLLKTVETFTVWAANPEQASDLVVKGGQGRPAGHKGPEVEATRVNELGIATQVESNMIEVVNG